MDINKQLVEISKIIDSGDILFGAATPVGTVFCKTGFDVNEGYLIETLVNLCMNCLIPESSDVDLSNVPIEFVLAQQKLIDTFGEICNRKKLRKEGLKIIKNFRATNIKI